MFDKIKEKGRLELVRVANRLYSRLSQEEVEGEVKYFKKREVYPPLTIEGRIRWKEFLIGNWKNFALVSAIVLITIGIIFEYISNLRIGAECIARESLKNNLLIP